MKLTALDLTSFRQHQHTQLRLESGVNLLYGRNGTGKTNLLEAIHYICLTKSFLGASDADCLTFNATHFELEAALESDLHQDSSVRVFYSEADGKNIFVNKVALDSFAAIVGEYPCVSLSPYDVALTQGAPQERRKFLDGTISQTNKAYLEDLVSYRRVLNQRNKLLGELRFNRKLAGQLGAWTDSLIQLASSIVEKRLRFAGEFSTFIHRAYKLFSSFEEVPLLRYDCEVKLEEGATKEEIAKAFAEKFQLLSDEELRRGITLLGPHRDDLEFKINGMSLKKFASQGQHKTFVICLRLAQHFYITALLNEKPIFLLDDVFSELDRERVENLVGLLLPLGQSVITTTERKDFSGIHQIAVADLR